MSLLRGKVFRIVVAGVFTAGICALVYPYLSWEALGQAFARVDPALLLASLAAYVGVTAVRALRFAIAGARLTFFEMFKIASVHAALLRVMPLRSGELAYGILLKKHGGGGLGEGIAAILMLRVLDLATVLPLATAVTLAWATGTQDSWSTGLVVGGTGLTLGVVFFSLGPLTRAVAVRMPPESSAGIRGIAAKVARTLVEAYSLPLPRRLALLAITAVIWGLVLAWFHLTLLSIGAVVAIDEGLVVGITGVVGSILPVSLLGSFGPMEGGLAMGLAAIGHSREVVAAESIVVSTLTFCCNWLVAIPMWAALAASFAMGGKGPNNRDISGR